LGKVAAFVANTKEALLKKNANLSAPDPATRRQDQEEKKEKQVCT